MVYAVWMVEGGRLQGRKLPPVSGQNGMLGGAQGWHPGGLGLSFAAVSTCGLGVTLSSLWTGFLSV